MMNNEETVPEIGLKAGRVRRIQSNFYTVELDGVLYECALRALVKKEGVEVLVGDRVTLDTVDAQAKTGRIASVLPRTNAITRPKLANIDCVLVVYSLYEPDFDPLQMDRYLTHVVLAGLTPVLVISKADLADKSQPGWTLEAIRTLYAERLGFDVFLTSVYQPDSLTPVRTLAAGKISVLAGPSGSGKSSLLNALNPELRLRVGEVSEKIGRGQHTTRHVELLAPDGTDPATLIADTPGFSNLKFSAVEPIALERAFHDFAPFREQCAFSDCLHLSEAASDVALTPDTKSSDTEPAADEAIAPANYCAVLANREKMAETRYRSYCAMLAEAREALSEARATSRKTEYGAKQVSAKGGDVKILRLKEKNRDASRRTLKQQFSQFDREDGDDG